MKRGRLAGRRCVAFGGAGIAALLLVAAANAQVHKCTDASGKVSYSEMPCPAGRAGAELQGIARPATPARGTWRFERVVDSMTGAQRCAVISPSAYVVGRSYRDITETRLEVTALPADRFALSMVIVGTRNIFHNDLGGAGIKPDSSQFVPFLVKGGQRVALTTQSSDAIDALLLAKSVRLRVRFWPYDDLLDTDPIQMVGFSQAIIQAAACAKGAG